MRYGHRHIGCVIDELISVAPEGFVYKNKNYNWLDITKIRTYDSLFWSLLFYQTGAPLAYIFLNDGEKIKIRGRVLERVGVGDDKVDFFTGQSNAYSELIGYMKKRVNEESGAKQIA